MAWRFRFPKAYWCSSNSELLILIYYHLKNRETQVFRWTYFSNEQIDKLNKVIVKQAYLFIHVEKSFENTPHLLLQKYIIFQNFLTFSIVIYCMQMRLRLPFSLLRSLKTERAEWQERDCKVRWQHLKWANSRIYCQTAIINNLLSI